MDLAPVADGVMSFKNKLLELIQQTFGSDEEARLDFVDAVRITFPTFTIARFSGIMAGQPLKKEEIQAMAIALGVHPIELIDSPNLIEAENLKKIIDFASSPDKMNRPDLADQLAGYVAKSAEFKNKILSHEDLYCVAHEFLNGLEDEAASL